MYTSMRVIAGWCFLIACQSCIGLNRHQSAGQWEIYNLEKDPSENRNIASKHPELQMEFNRIGRDASTGNEFFQWKTSTKKNRKKNAPNNNGNKDESKR